MSSRPRGTPPAAAPASPVGIRRGRPALRATANAVGSPPTDYRYAYDLAEQVTRESGHGAVADYTYDLAGQLVGAASTQQAGEAYGYAAAGNPAEGGRVVGPANRPLADAASTYGYDAEGNRTSNLDRAAGEATAYAYDHRGRLTGVERPSNEARDSGRGK